MHEPRTRQELLGSGMDVRTIAAAVHRGDLIRARRGHYLPRDAPPELIRAVRVGGRLSCLSLLREAGIWVLDDGRLHVHVPPNASRMRDPDDRSRRLHPDDPSAQRRVSLHWDELQDSRRASRSRVSLVDAFCHAARCLPERLLVASLDSALHQHLLAPAAWRRLREDVHVAAAAGRVDSRADSGLESIVREVCRELGFRVRPQQWVDGVGRVDMIVEDWVAIETDGRGFHDAETAPADRRRDARLLASGRSVLRFGYSQIVYELPSVARAIIAAVDRHRSVRNSGKKARRARRLLRGMEFS